MHDTDVDVPRLEAERLRAAEGTERKLAVIEAVASVLVGETQVDSALPRVLAALAGALGCSVAGYWVLDAEGLELFAQWTTGDVDGWGTARRRLASRSGLAGRIWAERSPLWIADIAADHDVVQREALVAAGIRSGFGFP